MQYVGRTERRLEDRIKEHIPKRLTSALLTDISSSITEHLIDTGHFCQRNEAFEILYKARHAKDLKFAEAVAIRIFKPQLNVQLAFAPPSYDSKFAQYALTVNLSVSVLVIPLTGDIEADFVELCQHINKVSNPIGLVDASWIDGEQYGSSILDSMSNKFNLPITGGDLGLDIGRRLRRQKSVKPTRAASSPSDRSLMSLQYGHHQLDHNNDVFFNYPRSGGNDDDDERNQLMEFHAIDPSYTIRCYRRQLLVSLSSRLQLPLITLTELNECPSTLIDSATDWESMVGSVNLGSSTRREYPFRRLSTPANQPMIHSIAPSQTLLAELLKQLVHLNEEKWKGFAIVYERSKDFEKFRPCIENAQTSVIIRRWQSTRFLNTQLIREIKHVQAYLLDLPVERLKDFFLMGPLDEVVEVLQNVKGNVALLRIMVPKMTDRMKDKSLLNQLSKSCVGIFAYAVQLAGSSLLVPQRINCSSVTSKVLQDKDGVLVSSKKGPFVTYKHGHLLNGYIKNVINSQIGYSVGVGGAPILEYGVEILQLKNGRSWKYAEWNIQRGFTYASKYPQDDNDSDSSMFKKTFIVATIEDPPFVIYEPHRNGTKLKGNKKWTGFAIELLEKLSELNHFQFKIKEVADRKFGTYNETTGQWTGIIGELVYKRADLAVASLTITYDRERVIDFTTPFMSLSLSVIIRKSQSKASLQFTAPLSYEVWISVLVAYIVVSLTLFLLGRVAPNEWYARHPCCDRVENQFTLLNSFWFTVGSLMQQGCDISPRATSTRIIGTIWWFFILIMVSSYTANLAAFLTIDRMETDIKDVEDLSRQTEIKYGALSGGATYSFFKNSDIDTYKRMWEFMDSNRSVFVEKSEEGIRRTLEGNYAFILESTLNEYYCQRHCQLTPLGGLLDPRGYGIGLPVGNSRLRDLLSESILKLQKDQVLEKMRKHWLQTYNATIPCYMKTQKESVPSRSQLTMDKMSSAFIGLGVGLLLGIVIWFVEIGHWVYHLRRQVPPKPVREMVGHFQRSLCGSCRRMRSSSESNSSSSQLIDESLLLVKPRRTQLQTGQQDWVPGSSSMMTAGPVCDNNGPLLLEPSTSTSTFNYNRMPSTPFHSTNHTKLTPLGNVVATSSTRTHHAGGGTGGDFHKVTAL